MTEQRLIFTAEEFRQLDDPDFADRPMLKKIYDENEQVRKLADKIHESRMLQPPACCDCIRMALKQLGIEIEK